MVLMRERRALSNAPHSLKLGDWLQVRDDTGGLPVRKCKLSSGKPQRVLSAGGAGGEFTVPAAVITVVWWCGGLVEAKP